MSETMGRAWAPELCSRARKSERRMTARPRARLHTARVTSPRKSRTSVKACQAAWERPPSRASQASRVAVRAAPLRSGTLAASSSSRSAPAGRPAVSTLTPGGPGQVHDLPAVDQEAAVPAGEIRSVEKPGARAWARPRGPRGAPPARAARVPGRRRRQSAPRAWMRPGGPAPGRPQLSSGSWQSLRSWPVPLLLGPDQAGSGAAELFPQPVEDGRDRL